MCSWENPRQGGGGNAPCKCKLSTNTMEEIGERSVARSGRLEAPVVAGVRLYWPRHEQWVGLCSGRHTQPPGSEKEGLKEQLGSGGPQPLDTCHGHLWTPQGAPGLASYSVETLSSSILEKASFGPGCLFKWCGQLLKRPRPRPHSDQVHPNPEEIMSPSVEGSENRPEPCPGRSTQGLRAGAVVTSSDWESCLPCGLAVSPWLTYSTSLSFSFPIYTMGLRRAIVLQAWGR